ncbi:hypothetical protein BC477_04740 [Clavibacter michiganensis subsp. michiganensis]|uniref:Uncharacterized protein n=1 Tax=Clavibacter michiganensis subsp. michiganensis TaxID=33013 RepID=A0A251XKN4_CLAMM|nr:hypothetical protein BC477_04740 [Clavibacter michiganensis subsp. michiganensis]OUE04021.1 hypothetical protein CMMCAS07_03670 [Clavibacter michiganensis subsp. michiganensis]
MPSGPNAMRPPLWVVSRGIPVTTSSAAPSPSDPGSPVTSMRTMRLSVELVKYA